MRACGFNTTVHLPILHVKCAIGLTLSEQMEWAWRSDHQSPPHSPDLTLLDFYLWGSMKETVYSTGVQDRDNLIYRTEMAAADIIPRQLVSVRDSIRCRRGACVQAEGGHLECVL
jgi:hypothetical protein